MIFNNSNLTEVPQHVRQYLWDVDQEKLSRSDHADFIIERVLEYGDMSALNWIREQYNPQEIKKVLINSRRISAKTGNFFALVYKLDPSTLKCLQEPYTQKQKRF